MKKSVLLLSAIGLIATFVACHKTPATPTGTAYLDLPSAPYSYFNSMATSDTSVNHKATLGRVLFYDGHLSLNNTISCGSCHKQVLGFSDNVAFSTGYQGKLTRRNSKGIDNLLGNNFSFFSNELLTNPMQPMFWDGREQIIENVADRPITNHVEMGMDDPNKIPAKLAVLPFYAQLFRNAYGDENITSDRISECIATFMASIQSGNSKFELYQKGLSSEMTTQELVGYSLFTSKYNCDNCHHVVQNSYSTLDFKDIGLDATYTDMGRGAVTLSPSDNGKFRVPSLINVALTAPYMHDGRFATLSDVIDHYSHNIQGSTNLDTVLTRNGAPRAMNITDADKQALIAFLNTLTDTRMITDPKFSNPFKIK